MPKVINIEENNDPVQLYLRYLSLADIAWNRMTEKQQAELRLSGVLSSARVNLEQLARERDEARQERDVTRDERDAAYIKVAEEHNRAEQALGRVCAKERTMKPSKRIHQLIKRRSGRAAPSEDLQAVVDYLDEQHDSNERRHLQANMNEMYGSMGREREEQIKKLTARLNATLLDLAEAVRERNEAREQVERYEAAIRNPGDDQRHLGTSVATQLVHAQKMREQVEEALEQQRALTDQAALEVSAWRGVADWLNYRNKSRSFRHDGMTYWVEESDDVVETAPSIVALADKLAGK
jgi:chromosome segregation ATPase